jgi:plastocyanin
MLPALTRGAEVSFTITDPDKRPVADAVVVLRPLEGAIAPATAAATLEIAQRNTRFDPFVTVLRTGSAVRLPNQESRIAHHVYSTSAPKRFEFPLYKPGTAETVIFDKPGLVVLGCNIHDSMLAYVLVVDSAWFAKTAANGNAAVSGVPPGSWRAEVWHPLLKEGVKRGEAVPLQRAITITSGAAAQNVAFSLSLGPDPRRRGPISGGGGYK